METYLPVEITEIILCHANLSISDVVNFSLTNKYYYDVIGNNNTLWKKKYFQIWPQFSKLFEQHDPDFSWYEEIKYVYDVKRRTREILFTMSWRFRKIYQLFGLHFLEWMKLYEETPRTYYYLVHDLKDILDTQVAINTIKVVPISTPGNKTLQYYATKVLRYLLPLHLLDKLHVKLPVGLPTLERAIVFLAQWCRPKLDESWKDTIPNKFDELAEKVKEHLKVVHPNHPLFAVPKEELKIWREGDIDGNKYDAENCITIVQALESVSAIFLGLSGTVTVLQENNFIEELAATDLIAIYGVYNSLLLTYHCVARRLGVKLEIVHSEDGEPNIEEDMLQRAELPIATTEQFDPIKAIHQYRFLRPPPQCPGLPLLELLEVISPFNISPKTFMKEFYIDTNIDSSLLFNSVVPEGILDPCLVKHEIMMTLRYQKRGKTTVKDSRNVRPPNLKFAVGMVVQHVRTHYKCVIFDWDPTCLAPVKWRQKNDSYFRNSTMDQPFYKILNQYGEHEYIPQDCLEPSGDTASLIMLKEIGRHFSHVFETHFVPNSAIQKQYPEDAAVRHSFHQKLKSGNLK